MFVKALAVYAEKIGVEKQLIPPLAEEHNMSFDDKVLEIPATAHVTCTRHRCISVHDFTSFCGRDSSIRAVEEAFGKNRLIF